MLEPVYSISVITKSCNEHLWGRNVEWRLRHVDGKCDVNVIGRAIVRVKRQGESTSAKDRDRGATNPFYAALKGLEVLKKLGVINDEPICTPVSAKKDSLSISIMQQ